MIPQIYFDKIKNYFNGDTAKTWLWFKANNPSLGGISPLEMIKCGRVEKLKKFIDCRLEGYLP